MSRDIEPSERFELGLTPRLQKQATCRRSTAKILPKIPKHPIDTRGSMESMKHVLRVLGEAQGDDSSSAMQPLHRLLSCFTQIYGCLMTSLGRCSKHWIKGLQHAGEKLPQRSPLAHMRLTSALRGNPSTHAPQQRPTPASKPGAQQVELKSVRLLRHAVA